MQSVLSGKLIVDVQHILLFLHKFVMIVSVQDSILLLDPVITIQMEERERKNT